MFASQLHYLLHKNATKDTTKRLRQLEEIGALVSEKTGEEWATAANLQISADKVDVRGMRCEALTCSFVLNCRARDWQNETSDGFPRLR